MNKRRRNIMKKAVLKLISLSAVLCLIWGWMTVAQAATIDKDREGSPITLPATIERIACFGPSNTEILSALGVMDKVVAADTFSANVEGVPSTLPLFDMMTPDAEKILALQPDLLLVTGMSKTDGADTYKPLKDVGVCVIYIPSSNSIDSIKEDIRYIAAVVGQDEKGGEIIARMEADIAAVKAVGDTITQKKSVYFELSAAPYLYSFGRGVFLNEMIELIGATNVLDDQDSWLSVTDEAVLSANPDVILTCVNYIDNPTDEIKARPGWDVVNAVRDGQVYSIDADASNRPSQHIVKALREMAVAVYPELYSELKNPAL
jgi:iron complex transport system substrate-binding protein